MEEEMTQGVANAPEVVDEQEDVETAPLKSGKGDGDIPPNEEV